MTSPYTPIPTVLPATVELPVALVDQRKASTVNVPFKACIDAIAFLYQSTNRRGMVSGNACIGATSLIAQSEPVAVSPLAYLSFTDVIVSTADLAFTLVSLSPDTYHAIIPIDAHLIGESTIGLVTATVIGASGHAGLPGVMPAMSILRYEAGINTMVSLFSGGYNVDTSASVAAYEAVHTISATPDQNEVVDKTKCTYFISVRNECGANALTFFKVRSVNFRMFAPRYL